MARFSPQAVICIAHDSALQSRSEKNTDKKVIVRDRIRTAVEKILDKAVIISREFWPNDEEDNSDDDDYCIVMMMMIDSFSDDDDDD